MRLYLIAVVIAISTAFAVNAAEGPRDILFGFAVALRNHKVWLVAGGGAIAAAPIFIFGSLWGVPYLMQVHGLERTVAASLTATILAGWGFGGFLIGWLSDRIGARRNPIVFGLVVAFISLTTLRTQAQGSGTWWTFSGGGIVLRCGASTQWRGLVGCGNLGSAYAFANMLMTLSGAIFQPVAGRLLDLNWSASTSIAYIRLHTNHFLMVPYLLASSL